MDVQNVQNSKAIAGSSESGAAGTWGGEYLLDFEVGAPSKPQRVHLFIYSFIIIPIHLIHLIHYPHLRGHPIESEYWMTGFYRSASGATFGALGKPSLGNPKTPSEPQKDSKT